MCVCVSVCVCVCLCVCVSVYVCLLPVVSGGAVMDVGCGSGLLSMMAARAGARHVVAIEASDFHEVCMCLHVCVHVCTRAYMYVCVCMYVYSCLSILIALLQYARKVVAANGFQDNITVVHGRVEDIDPADIVAANCGNQKVTRGASGASEMGYLDTLTAMCMCWDCVP